MRSKYHKPREDYFPKKRERNKLKKMEQVSRREEKQRAKRELNELDVEIIPVTPRIQKRANNIAKVLDEIL